MKLPLPTSDTPHEIRESPKLFPFFKDAVGAIDGTLIPANPSAERRARFRDRKGNITQNVLSACSFDMRFTYVLSGWEGSAPDSQVYEDAIFRKGLHLPPGKYFLGDAGFPGRIGLLVPYRGVRYHLREFAVALNSRPSNYKELFNLRHSQLRNVIERAFGVLKKRFRIIKENNDYSTRTQAMLMTAVSALHNFIMTFDPNDAEEDIEEEDLQPGARDEQNGDGIDEEEDQASDVLRDEIAHAMWEQYQNEIRRRNR